MTDIEKTLEERGNVYGSFKMNSSCTQSIIAILKVYSQRDLENFEKEALHMIAHKMSRIVCGTKTKKDNWHDIAGYATLAENETKDN